jgi:hypothetical protein
MHLIWKFWTLEMNEVFKKSDNDLYKNITWFKCWHFIGYIS